MAKSLPERKARHLDICLDSTYAVETGPTGLDDIRLPHHSLPQSNVADISLRTPFLGYDLALPVMISCMTGGSEKGWRLNRLLAEAAGERGIAFGLGSIRVMLRHPETKIHFMVRPLAPSIPILANIGAAQLPEYSTETLAEAVKSIEADGLYVHLNAAQEMFQDGGDTDFSGWRDRLHRLIDESPVPVLVKETGAGIPPAEGLDILRWGAAYVDVAGAGGTDWVAVESFRESGESRGVDASFFNWGYSTAELLLAYRELAETDRETGDLVRNRIIASGGIRRPRDYAVSIAGGAYLAAAALPFIRRAAEGADAVRDYIDDIEGGLCKAMVLSGSDSLDAFRRVRLRVRGDLEYNVRTLAEATWKQI